MRPRFVARDEGISDTCRLLDPGVGDEPSKTSSFSVTAAGRVGVGGVPGAWLRKLRMCEGDLNPFSRVILAGDVERIL